MRPRNTLKSGNTQTPSLIFFFRTDTPFGSASASPVTTLSLSLSPHSSLLLSSTSNICRAAQSAGHPLLYSVAGRLFALRVQSASCPVACLTLSADRPPSSVVQRASPLHRISLCTHSFCFISTSGGGAPVLLPPTNRQPW